MKSTLVRQSFLGPNSDRVLEASRVAIVGLGGGGSHIAQQLAHVGVGDFIICDDDRAEDSNLNRLVGATQEDVVTSAPKWKIAKRGIKAVNPCARVQAVSAKWQEQHALLRDRDIIFGCLDKYRDRAELETLCRRYLIPYIDIGMDVSEGENGFVISGQMILSMPGCACLRCFGFVTDDLLAREAEDYGAAGGRPQVVWPNGILASLAVGTFVHLMTPWHTRHSAGAYLEYDGNSQTINTSNRLFAVAGKTCHHYGQVDLGDPFWIPTLEK